jgi:integrase
MWSVNSQQRLAYSAANARKSRTIIKASPKIKLMQEHAWERVIDTDIEAKLLPFCKQPLRDLLMIMRDSGMRNQKEVFRMRWEHLDWGNKQYFVYESKSPKGRRFVPISPRVRQALLARYSEQKEGWIFPFKRARGPGGAFENGRKTVRESQEGGWVAKRRSPPLCASWLWN